MESGTLGHRGGGPLQSTDCSKTCQILWGGTFAPGVIQELILSEEAGAIIEFLEQQEFVFSYWSLGEDEYPDIVDATNRLHGTAEDIIFVER